MATETQEQTQSTETLAEGVEMFQQGMEIGKQLAQKAATGIAVWAEKSPEQVVLAGLVAGFVLGKVFFSSRRRTA
jgi:hypothetical protein